MNSLQINTFSMKEEGL